MIVKKNSIEGNKAIKKLKATAEALRLMLPLSKPLK